MNKIVESFSEEETNNKSLELIKETFKLPVTKHLDTCLEFNSHNTDYKLYYVVISIPTQITHK